MNMKYTEIDLNTYKRKEHFELFKSDGQCTFSMTAEIDITKLIHQTKSKDLKFYPVMIHTISKVVNSVPEFKMSMKDGKLIVWDQINPSYTIFHKESETFSSLWSYYKPNLPDFIDVYTKDNNKYGKSPSYLAKGEFLENTFFVSAVPWVSFTSFDMNFSKIENFFAPLFTMGKYFTRNDKVFIPLSVQVHHAVCDGFHIGKVINQLQKLCSNIEL